MSIFDIVFIIIMNSYLLAITSNFEHWCLAMLGNTICGLIETEFIYHQGWKVLIKANCAVS